MYIPKLIYRRFRRSSCYVNLWSRVCETVERQSVFKETQQPPKFHVILGDPSRHSTRGSLDATESTFQTAARSHEPFL